MNQNEPIKITQDDLKKVVVPDTQAEIVRDWGRGPRQRGSYGTIATSIDQEGESPEAGSFFRRSWVYLSLAGMGGAILGWGICEPFWVKGPMVEEQPRGLALFMCPIVVALMCFGFATAESWIERSVQKGLQRAVISLGLGIALGLVLNLVANIVFSLLLHLWVTIPPRGLSGGVVMSRALAWGLFGIASGIVYGAVGRSARKGLYGVVGGALGAFVGGLIFDPIGQWTQGGGASRAIGFALFGASTGLAMGMVESALKERWLYVSGGPLAGKQFILYKARTVFGSEQSADIYLFKDPSIQAIHAAIEVRGTQAMLMAYEGLLVNGQAVQERALCSGDQIQIGRYTFDYREKVKRS